MWFRIPTTKSRSSPAPASNLCPASRLRSSRSQRGNAVCDRLWSANPGQDGAGTIAVVSPSGSQTDLIADNAIQSGQIGAYLQMRDNILPQAQTQLDELANQMSQALSNQTTSGTAVTSGSQSGFSVDVGGVLPGNTLQLTYTGAGNTQHTVTIVALGQGQTLPQQSAPCRFQQPGDRRRLFRRHEFDCSATQCRARLQSPILKSFRHHLAGAQQRQRQCRQFAVGDVDRDFARERQSAASVVSRR